MTGCGGFTASMCAIPAGQGDSRQDIRHLTSAECAAVTGCYEWTAAVPVSTGAVGDCGYTAAAAATCKNSKTGIVDATLTTAETCLKKAGGCAFHESQCVLGSNTVTGLTSTECGARAGGCKFQAARTVPYRASCSAGTKLPIAEVNHVYTCVKPVAATCSKASVTTKAACGTETGCATHGAATCRTAYTVASKTVSGSQTLTIADGANPKTLCEAMTCGTWTYAAGSCSQATGAAGPTAPATTLTKDECENSKGGSCSDSSKTTKTDCIASAKKTTLTKEGGSPIETLCTWTPGVWTQPKCTSSITPLVIHSDSLTEQASCPADTETCGVYSAPTCSTGSHSTPAAVTTAVGSLDGTKAKNDLMKTACDDAAVCVWTGASEIQVDYETSSSGWSTPSFCADTRLSANSASSPASNSNYFSVDQGTGTHTWKYITSASRLNRDALHKVHATYSTCSDGSKNYGESETDCGGKRIQTGDTTTGTGGACDACKSDAEKKKDEEGSAGVARASWVSMLGGVIAIVFALLQ